MNYKNKLCFHWAATHADFGIDVPVVQFFIEDEEHGICRAKRTEVIN